MTAIDLTFTDGRTFIETEGFTIQIQVRKGFSWRKPVKTRIYPHFAEAHKEPYETVIKHRETSARFLLQAAVERGGYVHRGDDPVTDKLYDRMNRETVKVTKAENVIPALQAINSYFVDDLSAPKLFFSKTAGCSCGCSPAYVAERPLTVQSGDEKYIVESIFVDPKNK